MINQFSRIQFTIFMIVFQIISALLLGIIDN